MQSAVATNTELQENVPRKYLMDGDVAERGQVYMTYKPVNPNKDGSMRNLLFRGKDAKMLSLSRRSNQP